VTTAPAAPAEGRPSALNVFRATGAQSAAWPAAGIAIALLLQFHLVVTRSINWDEFYYYAQVEQYARGALTVPLQTIHVHLFRWLVSLPGNGVDHIVAGRSVMFLAELATLAAIFGISAHFTDRRTGLFCALAYLMSVYAFQHGFAFRVDPLAAALTMSALYVLLTSPLRVGGILAFSLLLGLAGMVTNKTVLYAPAFAGVAWLRIAESDSPRRTIARLAACVGGALAVFGAVYGLHARSLGQADLQAAGGVVEGSASYVVHLGWPVYRYYLIHAVRSPLLTILVLAAPLAIVLSDIGRNRKVALLGMTATGLCFFYYVNVLAYFYAFILPPIVCGACLAVHWVVRRYSSAAAAAIMAVCVVVLWVKEPPSPIAKQRLLLDAADEIFPQPVAYFDFCGMLGSFEKANTFMTTWGMQSYVSAGVPAMRQRMERGVVPLVLASEQQSYLTFEEMLTTTGPSPYFVDADAAALRDNYLPFWGPFWLAGKAVPADGTTRREEFLVPGPYTVHDAAVTVDGTVYSPGDVVQLDRGMHSLGAGRGEEARLIWGDRLKQPGYVAPGRDWWVDF
jgi:hypothetical protein